LKGRGKNLNVPEQGYWVDGYRDGEEGLGLGLGFGVWGLGWGWGWGGGWGCGEWGVGVGGGRIARGVVGNSIGVRYGDRNGRARENLNQTQDGNVRKGTKAKFVRDRGKIKSMNFKEGLKVLG
jgi:hypothetical protein